MTKKEQIIGQIIELSDCLIYEYDDISFCDLKEDLLSFLDVMIHEFDTIEYHYLENVEICRKKPSLIDVKLDERIMKGKFYVSQMAEERNVDAVKTGLKLLIDLQHQKSNRCWGHKGIYYEKGNGDG